MRSQSTVLIPAILALAGCATTSHQTQTTAESQAITEGLIGTWEDQMRSADGTGLTFLFTREKAVTMVFGAMVDGHYTLVGDQFTIIGTGGKRPVIESVFLTNAGDTAIFSAGSVSDKLVRIGPGTQADSIIGEWRYIHSTGMPGYNEYSADGRMRLRVPIRVVKGRYSVSGNTLTMRTSLAPNEDREAPLTLRGDTLTIDMDGHLEKFLRAKPLIPYDVEQPALPHPAVPPEPLS
jgi:hypothetical protein